MKHPTTKGNMHIHMVKTRSSTCLTHGWHGRSCVEACGRGAIYHRAECALERKKSLTDMKKLVHIPS